MFHAWRKLAPCGRKDVQNGGYHLLTQGVFCDAMKDYKKRRNNPTKPG